MQIDWDLYVFCLGSLSLLIIDDCMVAIAWRSHKGVDLYA